MSDAPPPPPPSEPVYRPAYYQPAAPPSSEPTVPPPPPPGSPPPPPPGVPPPPPGFASTGSRMNGMAIAALVCGIVGLLACFCAVPSVLALVFGLVSAKAIKRSGGSQRGLGLARAGWIMGLVGVLAAASFWSIALATDAFDDDGVSLQDIEIGMCVELPAEDEDIVSLEELDCAEPHDAEVHGTGTLAKEADYPGELEVQQAVAEACQGELFSDYVGADYLDSRYEVSFVYPSDESWPTDRGYICLVVDPSGDELVGSIAGSGD